MNVEKLLEAGSALVFDADKHRYTLDGVELPSVTTILKVLDKPALVPWAAKLQQEADLEAATVWSQSFGKPSLAEAFKRCAHAWRKKRDKAGDAGTQAHDLIEHHSRLMLGQDSEEPEANDEARYLFAGWQKWAGEVGYKPLAVEARVFCRVFGYAGTVDVIGEFPGLGFVGPVVADWKSSKGLYDEHRLQSIAYRAAVQDMVGGELLPGIVVVLPKETADPIEHYEIPYEGAAWDAFLGALAVYRWKKAS